MGGKAGKQMNDFGARRSRRKGVTAFTPYELAPKDLLWE
jgi:hypothetical protein